MAQNSINLNKLKDEIDTRKKNRGVASGNMNESLGSGIPKDGFLNKLQQSLIMGREDEITTTLKAIDNKAAIVMGKKQGYVPKINENTKTSIKQEERPTQMQNNTVGYDPASQERDELMFKKFEDGKKKTLTESLELYTNTKSQQLTSKSALPTNNPIPLNEVKQYLSENIAPLIEETINSIIIEMYAFDRINQVLKENKELIKSAVRDVIKEIQLEQQKKKAKLQ
jgi:hypothetical protein